MQIVLETDLTIEYRNQQRVLDNLRLVIGHGEIVGLVGQSGSGKTTLSMALLGLLSRHHARVHGSIPLDGADLRECSEKQLRELRGRVVSLIPQNAKAALTPHLRLERQFREAWLAHQPGWSVEAEERVRHLLRACDLPQDRGFPRRYPGQISTGQAQRVLISMALLHRPRLLVADEPTTALDLLTQREVLDLLRKLNTSAGMAILFVSHDLQAVASLAHKIAILHDGTIVEFGCTADVLTSLQHAYTRRLVEAIPRTGFVKAD